MKRPWQIWLTFSACLAVVFAAMGWITLNMLRLERINAEAQRQAALEETVRLALWRMDAAASTLIIQESARPYYDYTAFNPAKRVFPTTVKNKADDDLIPSPLLTQSSSNVLVYFNGIVGKGKALDSLTSPQVPTGDLQAWAASNFGIAPLMSDNRRNLDTLASNVTLVEIRGALGDQRTEITVARLAPRLVNAPVHAMAANNDAPPQPQAAANQADTQLAQQQELNWNEYMARQTVSQRGQKQVQGSKSTLYNRDSGGKGQSTLKPPPSQAVELAKPSPPPPVEVAVEKVDEDIMRPVWIRDFLVLARNVKVDGQTSIQGAWINWANLKKDLLGEIGDLFPQADLVRSGPEDSPQASRLMAALPVKLIPGRPANLPAVVTSSLAVPLALAWGCVGLAALAVLVLLAGAVSLSERRGAFVSAVTHELRTPLTTFRMYSEMLSEGMVKDEAKRKAYLGTLCTEGNRLSHLVENVLSYARLERGRARKHMERLPVQAIVERVSERLAQHAERCGMTLAVETAEGIAEAEVTTDLSAVEQILFNLVDNACKYASAAPDKRIHLETRVEAGRLLIRVRDRGPGIAREEARRLFKPFRKSAKHAAESAPGVGLGLALSRQLARQMGGDLRINAAAGEGACLDLTLPLGG